MDIWGRNCQLEKDALVICGCVCGGGGGFDWGGV